MFPRLVHHHVRVPLQCFRDSFAQFQLSGTGAGRSGWEATGDVQGEAERQEITLHYPTGLPRRDEPAKTTRGDGAGRARESRLMARDVSAPGGDQSVK